MAKSVKGTRNRTKDIQITADDINKSGGKMSKVRVNVKASVRVSII
jgi:hypothetical protein